MIWLIKWWHKLYKWYDVLDKKQCILSHFIDFPKVLDTVDHITLSKHCSAVGFFNNQMAGLEIISQACLDRGSFLFGGTASEKGHPSRFCALSCSQHLLMVNNLVWNIPNSLSNMAQPPLKVFSPYKFPLRDDENNIVICKLSQMQMEENVCSFPLLKPWDHHHLGTF